MHQEIPPRVSRPADGRPTVGVVIPSRDDAPLLERCLRALRAQTRVPDEIVVVDDGSRDDTAAVAQAFGARVVVLDGEGIPAASAAGYDAATTDIICRLDADCVPPADWVETMSGILEADAGLVAVSCGARAVDGPPRWRSLVPRLYLGAYRAVLTPTLGHPPLFGSGLALRRDSWRAVRGSVHRDDPLVHDDLDLAFHLGLVGRLDFRSDVTVGMAWRSFEGFRSGVLRVRRGFHTVVVHWPEEFPPQRWARLARGRRTHSPLTDPRDQNRALDGSSL
ncbi:glycosyltransferase family 2 protein [Microbacterium sp. 3J1]|uniref:glycosyltransferase n=1 Tax=Microbacterium sp. 3J1 TaxID=861269 RepID=UPI000AF48300|nr:glycosyltransferase family A protein [Microbacterium sp. 3J1]